MGSDEAQTRRPPSGERTPLLTMEGISKAFPGVLALDDVHLELRHGEVHALVGENGAGKSTLMKLLSGVYTAESGVIRLDGREVHVTNPRHAQELGISIIHQEFQLVPDLTVAQNIFIGREPRGAGLIKDRELNRRAAELFERLSIRMNPTTPVRDLTVAHQQMVEVARALSFDARVLIMDEPTAALNDAEVQVLFGLIRSFVTDSTGVIYISHRMPEIKQIADRITVMRDGRYVDTVETASTDLREVITMMVGRQLPSDVRPEAVTREREPALEVERLRSPLLKDVSFTLHRGEILGLAGLMGAGRTEVARAIVGADPRTGGTLRVSGRPVSISNPADAMRHGIGYLSEDRKRYGLLLDQSVTANIALSSLSWAFTKLGFIDDAKTRDAANKYVKALSVKTPGIGQAVRNLSGGNQQKVIIGKWLLRDCDVLIFDEPTRGIDVGAKEEIYQLLQGLAAEGKAILMISSELPEVLRLAERIVVMCEGRVTATLDNAEATQESIMFHATRFGADRELS